MENVEENVSIELYSRNQPAGEGYASEIMRHINDMSLPDLIAATKLSPSLATRLKQMAYEFPNKSCGFRAIQAFTGVVFKNFDYTSLSVVEKQRADRHIRIISSLYGWLKPEDIIKPYRLEYTTPLSPEDTTLWSFWKGKVTVELVRSLKEANEDQILNLLPADAAKCVDWKLVKRFAKVRKVDFLEHTGETVRSPHAGRLKALRGELLRSIIVNGLSTSDDLLSFYSPDMIPIPDYKYSDHIAFMV